jgi:hypothetical protein
LERFSATKVPFHIFATSDMGIPGRHRSRAFAEGNDDARESTSVALMMAGFYSIAVSFA